MLGTAAVAGAAQVAAHPSSVDIPITVTVADTDSDGDPTADDSGAAAASTSSSTLATVARRGSSKPTGTRGTRRTGSSQARPTARTTPGAGVQRAPSPPRKAPKPPPVTTSGS